MAQKLKTSLKIFKYSLLIVAITVCFVGCSKDDETKTPNPLVGMWENVLEEDWDGKNSVAINTLSFNSNWKYFSYFEHYLNDSLVHQASISGTYKIEKIINDKVTVQFTYNAPNREDETGVIMIGRDELGEFLLIEEEVKGEIVSMKFYRK